MPLSLLDGIHQVILKVKMAVASRKDIAYMTVRYYLNAFSVPTMTRRMVAHKMC